MKKLLLVGLLSVNIAHGSIYEFQKNDNAVSFLAKGKPALISIKGAGNEIKGHFTLENQTLSADIHFALDTLDTGIELRDEHLKENYLETKKYPEARLIIKDLGNWVFGVGRSFKGRLSLHGVEKEIDGNATITDSAVKADFKINLSDFNIDIPSFQGITVAESVTITVDAPVVKKD